MKPKSVGRKAKLAGREREVCDGYLDGLSSIELSNKFQVSKPTILKILKKCGIARRSLMHTASTL